MAINDTQAYLLNNLLALTLHKIVVPADFHTRVKAVKEMLDDDISGIVDSLTDFSVESATVDFKIETSNDKLTDVLTRWLETINQAFRGKVPSGIKPLAQEYYKERWKASSFPVLRIAEWAADPVSKLILPSKMLFVDGGSIHARDKDPKSTSLSLDQYEYYLGKSIRTDANVSKELNPSAVIPADKVGDYGKNKLDTNVIFSRPYGRWYDPYPSIYLIKRGVYHNWRIIASLKRNEIDVLDQVIPYLLTIKKGSEKLALDKGINYDDTKLQLVIEQMEELIQKTRESQQTSVSQKKTPIRASQFDEEIKHLIPDLEALFKTELFVVAEKNILAGLGFIDIVDGSTSSRRESILNPKPFIQEVTSGVDGFKQILKDVLLLIIEKNKDRTTYMGANFEVTNTPVKGFMTDKFKSRMIRLWEDGLLSSQLAVELVAETSFEVEVQRREKEAKSGIDLILYPHLKENREDKGIDVVSPEGENLSDEERDAIEKKNINKASLINPLKEEMDLIGSPYASVKDLPETVTKRFKSIKTRRAWLSIFNSAYNYYLGKLDNASRAESLAFSTANAKIKNVKPVTKSKK